MKFFLKQALLAEAKPLSDDFRYEFLSFVSVFLVLQAWFPVHPNFIGFVAPALLLLNYLAFHFPCSRPVTIALRSVVFLAVALIWGFAARLFL